MLGMIFDIKRFAVHDGPGIRTTVFFKGCPMDCHWCHNPESRAAEPQTSCEGKMIGFETDVARVMKEIEKEVIFYDTSGGGVTFSGGEPLMQPVFLECLLDECMKRDIHRVLDTTGYAMPEIFNGIIDKTDLFYFDVKIMDEARHIHYTGVSNKPIRQNLEELSRRRKAVVVRFPVIPGITDDEANIKATAEYVSGLAGVLRIDLLPYHRTADAKYRRLQMPNRVRELVPPTDDHMNRVVGLFESYAKNLPINKE